MITIGELVPNEAWEKFKQDLEVIHRKLYVSAYNQALEDVVKVGEGDPYIYVRDIEKLKIRD